MKIDSGERGILRAYIEGVISLEQLKTLSRDELLKLLASRQTFKVYLRSADGSLSHSDGSPLSAQEQKESKEAEARGEVIHAKFNYDEKVQ